MSRTCYIILHRRDFLGGNLWPAGPKYGPARTYEVNGHAKALELAVQQGDIELTRHAQTFVVVNFTDGKPGGSRILDAKLMLPAEPRIEITDVTA